MNDDKHSASLEIIEQFTKCCWPIIVSNCASSWKPKAYQKVVHVVFGLVLQHCGRTFGIFCNRELMKVILIHFNTPEIKHLPNPWFLPGKLTANQTKVGLLASNVK